MFESVTRYRATGRSLVAGLFVAMSTLSASAETLADALVGAYQHSGVLDQQRALLRATDEDVAQAMSRLLPTLDYQLELARTWGHTSASPLRQELDATDLTISLIASWQLYDFGADQAQIDAAKETVLATRAGLLSFEQRVLARAVAAFMNVRAGTEVVGIRQSNIRLLQQELRAAQDRFELGEDTRTDVALAESALAAARSDLAAAQGNLQQFREEYRVAVGRYPGRLSAPPRLPRLEKNVKSAQNFAVRNHPDVIQARHLVASSELLIQAADKAQMPNVTLRGQASVNERLDSVDQSTVRGRVSLDVSGPIYQGGRLSSLVRQAMARRDANRHNQHIVRHDIFAAVGNAYADLQSSVAQIEATDRRIRAARVAFDGVREEAKLGSRTTLDVLDAEQQLLDAQASRISAQAQQYVAAYGVLSSMGLLTAQSLKLPVQVYDPSAYYNLVKEAPTASSKQGKQLDRVLRALNK